MKDITSKRTTLRTAKACAFLLVKPETMEKIKANAVPKGNIFEIAKAAGFLGAKKTPDLIPHCHSISIDSLQINYQLLHKPEKEDFPAGDYEFAIYIEAEGKSIGRTGIEMEVLTCVSVTALVLYDLLKPLNQNMEISGIRLLEKKGGKSDPKFKAKPGMDACILVCSDSTSEGKREDSSGKIIREMLEKESIVIKDYKIVPDNVESIQNQIRDWIKENPTYIITTGGTGLSHRDLTIEAVRPLLDKEIPGIAEVMREYGVERTPWAMLSRSIAGSIGKTLVVTLPGSSNGAKESMEAIIPGIFHARKMLKGGGHS
ncbi:MAG: bifunctional molybdenum cofactor biosynthesis protein MoaC/MoaB [Leptospiraceae bacterium]|nr:bifunctional molybdenum cofactor biosynthesis protein MoaC/MoaB [Leptospiraceae bacterium]MCP5495577.1 bifunctional molybdenum cofactor biosynthesis protein MoaC/MoaB [Leptospiraceae bacterium]